MVDSTEIMSRERLDRYIREAAQSAAYEEGFGIKGCDLTQRNWGAVYTRQSLREQAENDRLGEYFLTCAKLAKQEGIIVPEEYIIYDNSTSEHLQRSGMIRLRTELISQRLISGVFIPTLGRLSMDDHHRQTFEKECQYHGVKFFYGDAPSGMDMAVSLPVPVYPSEIWLELKPTEIVHWPVILVEYLPEKYRHKELLTGTITAGRQRLTSVGEARY